MDLLVTAKKATGKFTKKVEENNVQGSEESKKYFEHISEERRSPKNDLKCTIEN